MSKIKKLLALLSPSRETGLDRWLDKNLNAYGWRGFLSGLIFFGTAYLLMFFGAEQDTPSQELTYQARMFVVNKAAVVILILMLAKLIRQYASKEEREAHQEKMRKDALMEAEILERKEEKENIGQKAN